MRYTKLSIFIPSSSSPFFIGSQIRGAFGHALKKVCCINPAFRCEECFASQNCTYFDFFEKKDAFHRYRFDFMLGKREYDFHLYLFDEAIQTLPYVVSAIYTMLTKNGLGKKRTIYNDFTMLLNEISILKNDKVSLPKLYEKSLEIHDFHQNITLYFKTPLRMKKNNKLLRNVNGLELSDLINSIYQRQMRLLGKKYRKFPYAIEGEIVQRDLFFKDLTRYSNRQKTKMHLGGVMGSIKIRGLNQESYEILKVGELIGVGKQCVFGLGKIAVEKNDE